MLSRIRSIVKKNSVKLLILLHVLLMEYSISGIFSKLAAGESPLSPKFLLLYGSMILILGIYAIGWQQIIKRMPLSTAYANKAVCTVWGSVWGIAFFGESLSVGKVIGIVLIVIGIVLFATDREAGNE